MVVGGKRADGGRERDGMLPTDAMLSMSNGSDGYKPSRHLVKVDNLPPLVKEAADKNTELWLVRLPANEIGKTDLHEKRLELCIDGTEGIIGQFSGAQDVNVKQSEQVTSFSAENAQVSPVQRKKSKKRRKSDPS